jgi:RNA-directed DNA polymerase
MSAARVFKKLFRKNNIKKTFLDRIKNTNAVGLDKVNNSVFEKQLSSEIDVISRKAQNGTYNFTPYKQKLISKGADSLPRVISIPTFRDRITLRIICDLLTSVFHKELSIELPQIKIEAIKNNIKKEKYDSFIKIDIASFYPNVNHDKLEQILKSKIRKTEILELINKSIKNHTLPKAIKGARLTNKKGIPQGLANSNVLGEIYLHQIDSIYKKKKNIFYTRYVDDILIFCKSKKLEKLSEQLSNEFNELGLTIHPIDELGSKSTSGNLSSSFDYLGYLFTNKVASLKHNNRIRFESSLVNLFTNFKYKHNNARTKQNKDRAIDILNWRLNLKVTGCIFDNKKRGWIFYFSQLEDLNILHEIDNVIAKLIIRFGLSTLVKPKTLIKSYHEAKRTDKDSHKYIINFDTFDTPKKRKTLEMYLGEGKLKTKSDVEIDRLFKLRIKKIIEELEEDLKDFS